MTDLMDDDGENRAVRTFLLHYGAPGLTVAQMRENMRRAGWDGCWPEWVNNPEVPYLTKAGAQHWLRHLFSLEPVVAARTELPQPTTIAEIRRAQVLGGLRQHQQGKCRSRPTRRRMQHGIGGCGITS
jgi:hypothetical protein